MLDRAADDFGVVIGTGMPVAAWNERTTFEKSHCILLDPERDRIAQIHA
jgi:hypothetical protein